jgi:hypothetical protein
MDPCIVDDSVEIPTRCSFVIEFIIPKFIEGSTCFELIIRSSELNQRLQIQFRAPDDGWCAAQNMLSL